MAEGQIWQSLSGFYDVSSEGKIYRTRARGNFRNQKITPLVGDFVTFESSTDKEGYILAIHERRNELVRPPLANVDMAVVVTSITQPEFSTNLLDRQLIALEVNHIHPVIYFTKTDLVDDDTYERWQRTINGYRDVGYEVFYPRAAFDEQSLSGLKALFTDKETVIMGQTGAGKSTLLNHIAPELELATGEISTALNRGKHTTRKVGFLEINGGVVADTPGFSSYETLDINSQDLRDYFPEFKALAPQCKFRGCVHINEPGCAVKQALDDGEIMPSRYDNYLLLYQLLKDQKPDYNKNKK